MKQNTDDAFGIDADIQEMFYGGALVIAVTLSQLISGRQEQQF